MNLKFACLGLAGVIGWAYAIAFQPTLDNGTQTIALLGVMTLMMAWFWRQAQQGEINLDLVLLLGLGARAALVGVPIYTTHDVTRYLWDGAVLLQEIDPYLHHPDHPLLSGLRAYWPTPEEHAAYPTLYPPLSLALYAMAAWAGPVAGVWLWKVFSFGASALALVLIDRTLQLRGHRQHLPLFALSPLVLLETGIGAHIDSFSMLAVCLALWALTRHRWWVLGVALGFGASIKLLPAVLLLPLLVTLSWPAFLRTALATGLVFLSSYGAAFLYGLEPLGSLPQFFANWRFGSPLFSVLEVFVPTGSQREIQLLLGVLGALVVIYMSRRDLIIGCMSALALPLLLAPVSFPWYLLVLAPFVALRPNAWLVLWMLTAPLTYEVLDAYNAVNLWAPAQWPLWIIAIGWGVGLAIDYLRGRANAAGTDGAVFAKVPARPRFYAGSP